MYAIVKTGGKQYRVERGQTLLVERLAADEGSNVALEPILYRSDDAVFDAAGAEEGQGHGEDRRARARREAARVQVQAQARLQAPHRPSSGADADRGHRHLDGHCGSKKTAAKPKETQDGS